jgi:osmotically-inducible protein OsmY
MIRQLFARICFLTVLCVAFIGAQAAAQGEYGGSQQKPTPDQSTTTQQSSQSTENQAPAQAITEAFKQDPAFSKVTVNSNAKQITLHGTVTDKAASDRAEQIAQQHASGRKVVNKIKINKNTNPGPGL